MNTCLFGDCLVVFVASGQPVSKESAVDKQGSVAPGGLSLLAHYADDSDSDTDG